MRKTNKFIFTCLVFAIIFASELSKNVPAAHEDVKSEPQAANQKEEITLNTGTEGRGEEATDLIAKEERGEEHASSEIWPHYGKMVIFAEIMLAFMLFSFAAPLFHFYLKGEKHH